MRSAALAVFVWLLPHVVQAGTPASDPPPAPARAAHAAPGAAAHEAAGHGAAPAAKEAATKDATTSTVRPASAIAAPVAHSGLDVPRPAATSASTTSVDDVMGRVRQLISAYEDEAPAAKPAEPKTSRRVAARPAPRVDLVWRVTLVWPGELTDGDRRTLASADAVKH